MTSLSKSYFTAGEKCCSRCETLQLFIYYVNAQIWLDLRFRARLTYKAVESQSYADIYYTQKFYGGIKAVYSPRHTTLHSPSMNSKDNVMPIKEHQGTLSRWVEHVYLSELLSCINPTDSTFAELTPQLPILPNFKQLPILNEVQCTVKLPNNNKAAGSDGVPAEVLTHSGHHIYYTPASPLHLFYPTAVTRIMRLPQW